MWDDLPEPWRVCLSLSWEAYCEGSVPVGAAIIDPQGSIIAQGRNRISATTGSVRDQIHGGQLAHAELNALLALDSSSTDVHAVELFTTVEPCPLCIGAICMAGVKSVRYAAHDTWAGSTNLLDASPYLKWKKIRAIPPQDSELETIVHMLMVVEQLRSGHPRTEDVLEKWSAAYPDTIRRGRLLFASGVLERLRVAEASASEVVDYLHDISQESD